MSATQPAKQAVVTGASSGIGAATARMLAGHGMQVFLVARRAERLQGLTDEIRTLGVHAIPCPADLTDESQRLALFDRIMMEAGHVDLLVNNAGFGWYGYYANMPWGTALEMLKLNVAAVAHMTSLFLPSMHAQEQGHIVNLGSIAGSIPSQGIAFYSATKSFLDAFTTALHRELRGSGVHASVVRTGPVATEFYSTAAQRPMGLPIPAERFATSAQQIARHIWRLVQHPRRVIYVPRILRVVPWMEASLGWFMDRLGPLLLRQI